MKKGKQISIRPSSKDQGFSVINDFLSDSKIITLKRNSEEDENSQDGILIVYESGKINNRAHIKKGMIPVRIRPAQRKDFAVQKFKFSKKDLETYLKDGGIIFIRPVFKTIKNYSIFYKLLLPSKLKTLISKKKRNEAIVVALKKVSDVKSFEVICNFFLDNRKGNGSDE